VCTAAALAGMLGLPGACLPAAVLMRDKYLQKQAIQQAGLPAADAWMVVAGSDRHRIGFPGPCVVKPLAGAGSQTSEFVTTEAQYRALLDRLAGSASSPLIVERLVDVERELCVDGVASRGSIVFSSVATYSQPFLRYVRGGDDGDTMCVYRQDGTGEDALCAAARVLAARALSALGYADGVFHLELLLEAGTGTLYFGECAGRRGGAMIQEQVLVKHRYSLARAAVQVALGEQVRPGGDLSPRHVAMTYLFLPEGTILRLPDARRLLREDYVHDVEITAKLGIPRPRARPGEQRHDGMSVVSGGSAGELEANLAAVRADYSRQAIVAPTGGPPARLRAFTEGYQELWRSRPEADADR
jgi:hypothetical protein